MQGDHTFASSEDQGRRRGPNPATTRKIEEDKRRQRQTLRKKGTQSPGPNAPSTMEGGARAAGLPKALVVAKGLCL
jgi:hypothetical protein